MTQRTDSVPASSPLAAPFPPAIAAVPARAIRLRWAPALVLAPLLPLYLAVAAIGQPWGRLSGDEGAFLDYAHRILAGEYAAPHTMNAIAFLWHGPGIPALLTPFVAVHVPLDALRFLMPLLLFGAVVVFHRTLRLRLEPRPALAGALALGLYLPAYETLNAIHKEPLAMLLVVLALLGMARYLGAGRRRDLLLGGVALAALVMTRLEYGWVVIALLAICAGWWALRRASVAARRATALMAVALLGCAPWLVYTYSQTHEPLYWGNSGGSSLYWMSPTGAGETGQWHAGHTVFRYEKFARYRPFFMRLAKLTPLERNAELERVAKSNIRAHPLEYARNIVANAGRMWLYLPFWPRPPPAVLALCWLFGGALVVLAGWAAATLVRQRRSALPPETLPIAGFAAIALLLHLFTCADPRMTYPIVPALIWLVALAVTRGRRGARLREAL